MIEQAVEEVQAQQNEVREEPQEKEAVTEKAQENEEEVKETAPTPAPVQEEPVKVAEIEQIQFKETKEKEEQVKEPPAPASALEPVEPAKVAEEPVKVAEEKEKEAEPAKADASAGQAAAPSGNAAGNDGAVTSESTPVKASAESHESPGRAPHTPLVKRESKLIRYQKQLIDEREFHEAIITPLEAVPDLPHEKRAVVPILFSNPLPDVNFITHLLFSFSFLLSFPILFSPKTLWFWFKPLLAAELLAGDSRRSVGVSISPLLCFLNSPICDHRHSRCVFVFSRSCSEVLVHCQGNLHNREGLC